MYIRPLPKSALRSVRGLGLGDDESCPACSCYQGHIIGFLLGAVGIFFLQEVVRSAPTIMKSRS